MTYDGVFLADGPSDLPLARHLEQLCKVNGASVSITRIDPELLAGSGRTVEGRLAFLKEQLLPFSIIFVHRDSESIDPAPRYREIGSNVRRPGVPATSSPTTAAG